MPKRDLTKILEDELKAIRTKKTLKGLSQAIEEDMDRMHKINRELEEKAEAKNWEKREFKRLADFREEVLKVKKDLDLILSHPEYKDHYITEGIVASLESLSQVLYFLLY